MSEAPATKSIPLTELRTDIEQTEQSALPRAAADADPPDPLKILWADALAEIQLQTDPTDFKSFFVGSQLRSLEGGEAIIQAPSDFALGWLLHFEPLLWRVLSSLGGEPLHVMRLEPPVADVRLPDESSTC